MIFLLSLRTPHSPELVEGRLCVVYIVLYSIENIIPKGI